MLKTPRLSVVRNDDLSYNFSDLLEEFTAKPEPQSEPPPATEPLHFSFNNIRLQNGRIDFDDRPKRAQHTVADLNLGLPFLSNLPYDVDVYTEPSFAVNVNGTPIELTGRSKPFSDSRETSLDVNINNVELPKYLEYVPADLRFNLNSGNLSTKLALSFTQPKEPTPVLVVKGKIELNRLAVTDLDGHPVVSLSLLDVPVELLDVFGRKANLGTILLQGPKVHLRLNKAGVLNVTTLVEDRQAETGEKTGTEIKQTQAEKEKVEAGNEAEKAVGSAKETEALEKAEVETVTETRNIETEQKTAESVPVVVEIPEIRLTDGKVTFIDDTQEQSFQTTLDDLNIVARQVSTDATKPMTLEVSCKSDAGEVIQQTGTVVRLKWKSLHVTGVNVNTRPFLVSINEVTLADFYSRLTINPDTTLNVQGIVIEQPLAAPTAVAQVTTSPSTPSAQINGESTPIKIAKVTLRGGTVNFSDYFIKPNYSAKLTQLRGRVSDLISTNANPADVDLRTRLGAAAPLTITGKVNPFSKDLFVDLLVDFKDVDLNPMTPYSGKYAGHTIEKGKLTLNLHYLIANRQLKAENKVVIDQFTFGDAGNSPDATGLPVKLTVSLLKDRNGTIKLDVPLTGSLDDPQFSVWGMLVQVLTNLIAKAATSPFALIGAALGGSDGEEMNQVEFAYGRATLDEPSQEKMKKISEALIDRPSLSLDRFPKIVIRQRDISHGHPQS